MKQKQKETINGIPIINTLNSDINRKINSEQIPIQNLFKRDKIRLNRNSFHSLVSKKNINQIKSKKNLMTKEQRTILKSFLKENAKKNRKTVAKNLIGFFVESSKNSQQFQFKNKLVEKSIKKMESMKGIAHTPRAKMHIIKKSEKKSVNVNKEKIKKKSTFNVGPSMFSKAFKNNNKKEETKKSNKELNIKMINFDKHIKEEEEDYSNIVEFNKNMNFTNLFKLQQNINEINEMNDINTATRFSSPKRLDENPLKLNFELDDKKSMVFQIKSFRDFVEDNIQKNYDECHRFINDTSLISHLSEPDKTLIIQSLKIKKYKKGQCIQKSQEKFNIMYFVKEGLLQCVDEDGTCIKTLTVGQNFGEKEIFMDIKSNYNIITISECICFIISVKSLKKMFGHKFRKFVFYNFLKAAFNCSKLFQSMNIFYTKRIFKFFNIVNLNKDNVAFPIGHVKSSKMIIIISGSLLNSKTGKKIGGPFDILFEEELISLSEEKIKYALDPSPDADTVFLEGDTKEILFYLKCTKFDEVFNKNLIFENLSQIILFKAFSPLKLYKLIDLIHIENYKDGEKIITEGINGDKFYIVKTGQVEVFQRNIYLRTLNSMEYFGERALLMNEVRSASVIAKGDVELYCLDKDNFKSNLSNMMLNYLNISLYLHDETVSLNDLLFIKEIGKGNYGSVSLVMNKKTKFPYAIKAICKNLIIKDDLAENILLEKNILLKIDHPFIVKLVKSLKDENNVYFLLEYVKGKELFEVIRDIGYLSKEQTNFYIASIMTAINYLHERKIIYRDIKPENIMVLKNGYLKLIDFGTAKEIEDRTKTIIGTPHYMAPEVILGREYSFPVDFWSISICMYEFICGEVPFGEREDDPMEIYFAIINNELDFNEKYIKIDKEFKHIMKKMLDKNPSYRLCNFHSIKSQAWFKDFNWDELSNLNLKAPYIPKIPETNFDFDEQCKPKFDVENNKFREYVDYLEESNKQFEDLGDKITKEQLDEYMKWFNKF